MSNQTLEHLSSIDTNVETILSVLKGTLTVSVLNYGLVGNNVPD